MLEDLGGQRVTQRQLGEHVGIGRVPGLCPAQRRQLELLEEDLRELLGRGDGEFLAGQVVDLAREVVEVALELLGERLEPRGIHADTDAFHLGEHRHQRPLDLLIDVQKPALVQVLVRVLPEAVEPARAIADGAWQVGGSDAGERLRTLAEHLHADLVEPVRRARRVQQIRGHRRVVDRRRRRPRLHPRRQQRLGVVRDQPAAVEHGRTRGKRRREARAAEGGGGGAGVGMKEAQRVDARRRRARIARPVEGEAGTGGHPRRPLTEARRLREHLHRTGIGRRRGRGQLLDQARELHLHPERTQPRPVGLDAAKRLEVEGQRHAAADRGQLAREQGLLAAERQRLAQLAGDEREVVVEALDGAVLGDQLHGRLLAHPLDAGDVVDRVAHEGHHVGNLLGPHAPALAHLGLVVHDALARAPEHGQHAHARADELQQVLVAGDDDDVEVGHGQRVLDEGGQRVVGLVARHLEDRRPERVEQAADVGQLAREVVRHRRARGLVVGEHRVAERRTRRIQRDAEVVGLLLADELPEHRAQDQHRVARHALRRREVADRVVGAEDVRVAVDDVERLAHAKTSV